MRASAARVVGSVLAVLVVGSACTQSEWSAVGTTTSTSTTTLPPVVLDTADGGAGGPTTIATPTLTIPAAPAVVELATEVCSGPPAETIPSITRHTIAVQMEHAERFAAVVVPDPPAACPGDLVDFVVHVENLTGERQFYVSPWGLLFYQGGPTKWELGSVSLQLEPRETGSVVVTANVPDVAAGTYGLGVATGSGEMIVLDPATARSG